MSRLITVPETLTLPTEKPEEGKEAKTKSYSFKEMVTDVVENSKMFSTTLKMARAANRIIDACAASVGAKVKLSEPDHRLLYEALDGFAWSPAIGRRLTPYFDAVETAEVTPDQ